MTTVSSGLGGASAAAPRTAGCPGRQPAVERSFLAEAGTEHAARSERSGRVPADERAACGQRQGARQASQQRCLARAVGPPEARPLSGADRQVDPVQHRSRAEPAGQPAHLDGVRLAAPGVSVGAGVGTRRQQEAVLQAPRRGRSGPGRLAGYRHNSMNCGSTRSPSSQACARKPPPRPLRRPGPAGPVPSPGKLTGSRPA